MTDDAWIGLFGGILIALVSALVAILLQRAHEYRKEKATARLAVYTMLLELNNLYFWVVSSEMQQRHPPEEILVKCREVSSQLSEKLRTFDTVEHLEEILTVLFSSSFKTANDRARRLDRLIDAYGELVNPKFAKAISKVSQDNLLGQMQRGSLDTNAPGAWRYERTRSSSVEGDDS
ncbi:hypothetical protein [Pseudoxanthomonas japonensis]|uniref:Uncharacterized protein n=1 Tax=Pseudoxanthomonas japonensis TaxID=69284 RepID=A0ABQ6ZLH3_9GAMM|nr:hypothetical protein [Pseudoxanthomonas japonensis]KAF1727065.1 hypothetical protein CSC78_02975 [Pseudoxanthomonas japonensis]